VVDGPSNNSYGIHVARLAGVPGEVVDRAEAILQELLARSGEEFGSPRGLAESATEKDLPARSYPVTASRSGRVPPGAEDQGSLFGEDELIRSELSGLDVNRLTPLEALNLLSEWKERLRG
jgi:DNA mismatch repair protein MutS